MFVGFRAEYFIGGLPVLDDIQKLQHKIHMVIGAPGRIKSLIDNGSLRTKSIKLLILDEADKLSTESFTEDIKFINSKLPSSKQIIASSATFTDNFQLDILKNPVHVSVASDIPTLIGK